MNCCRLRELIRLSTPQRKLLFDRHDSGPSIPVGFQVSANPMPCECVVNRDITSVVKGPRAQKADHFIHRNQGFWVPLDNPSGGVKLLHSELHLVEPLDFTILLYPTNGRNITDDLDMPLSSPAPQSKSGVVRHERG